MRHFSHASWAWHPQYDPWPLDADGFPWIPRHTRDWAEFTSTLLIAEPGVRYTRPIPVAGDIRPPAAGWSRINHPRAEPGGDRIAE